MGDDKLISAGEAARRKGCDIRTIRKWINDGKLSVEYTLGGHRRVNLAELNELMQPTGERLRLVQPRKPETVIPSWVEQAAEWQYWAIPEHISDDQIARLRRDARELTKQLAAVIDVASAELARRDSTATGT